jgi:hypothetical protein
MALTFSSKGSSTYTPTTIGTYSTGTYSTGFGSTYSTLLFVIASVPSATVGLSNIVSATWSGLPFTRRYTFTNNNILFTTIDVFEWSGIGATHTGGQVVFQNRVNQGTGRNTYMSIEVRSTTNNYPIWSGSATSSNISNSDPVRITTGSVTASNGVLAMASLRASVTYTADTDTKNGSWNALNSFGTPTYLCTLGYQSKIVNADGTQSWDAGNPGVRAYVSSINFAEGPSIPISYTKCTFINLF